MRILLTGPRGSGKTYLGKKLSKLLNLKFIDLDEEIVKKEGKNISQIVKIYGWKYFRDKEHQYSKEISKLKNIVLATGGGTLMFERNLKLFKDWIKILLIVHPKIAIKRIEKDSKNRPSLTGEKDFISEWKQVWKQRKEKYFKIADFIVDTSKRNALSKIVNFLKLRYSENVCVSVKPKTWKEFKEKLKKIPFWVKFVELRGEDIKYIRWKEIKNIPFKMIFADYSGKGLERFKKAEKAGFSFITLDYLNPSHLNLIKKLPKKRIILSYHNFKKTPKRKELIELAKEMMEFNPNVLKIITFSKSLKDNQEIVNFIKYFKRKYPKKNLICFAMGEKGKRTRVISLKLGCFLTYLALDKKSKTAKGQITLKEYETFRDNRESS